MKKHMLTKQGIQKELLAKINKSKTLSIYLTVLITIAIILYSTHLINYLNSTPFDYTGGFKSPDLSPAAAMVVMPLLILFFIAVVLHIYYIDLYNIKKGNFQISEEKLCQKEVDLRRYYRHTEKKIHSISVAAESRLKKRFTLPLI